MPEVSMPEDILIQHTGEGRLANNVSYDPWKLHNAVMPPLVLKASRNPVVWQFFGIWISFWYCLLTNLCKQCVGGCMETSHCRTATGCSQATITSGTSCSLKFTCWKSPCICYFKGGWFTLLFVCREMHPAVQAVLQRKSSQAGTLSVSIWLNT